jgi:hypothetical protein
MKTKLTTGKSRRLGMKFFSSVCISAMLMVPPSVAAEMSGMYYCNGTAAAGLESGKVVTYAPHDKLTIKVDQERITISGDLDTWYGLSDQMSGTVSIVDESGWVYASGPGIFNEFKLERNAQGGFDFQFTVYSTDSTFLQSGKCQRW